MGVLNPYPNRDPYDREIWALAWPALGALAADPLVSLVDTAFVGQLGATPLGALGVNASIFSFTFWLFAFLAYATTPMIARAMSKGQPDIAGVLINHALSLALLSGFISLILLQLAANPLIDLMGAQGELAEATLSYYRIRACSAPAVLVIMAGHGIFRGFQDTRTPFYVTLGLNLINLVLDPIFIFVLHWGLTGAAWATLIAQWLGAVVFIWLFLIKYRKTLNVPLTWPAFSALKPFLKIGSELVIRTMALAGTLLVATGVATRLGTVSIAAHQVALQLWLFLALVIDALAIASQALMAKYIGLGQNVIARHIASRLLWLGLWLGLILMGGFLISRGPLANLFSNDLEVLSQVGEIFIFVAVMQPLNALIFVWDGIFMGREDFRFLAISMVIAAAIAVTMLRLVIPFGWGLTGVWWSMIVLMLLRFTTLWWRYNTDKRF